MATVKVNYLGGLRTECTHIKSGTIIQTDAPTDNKGKGEKFSPTDLVATAYVSCMLSLVGIYCEEHNIAYNEGTAEVDKIMASNPRRIEKLNITLDFTGNNWDEKTKVILMRVAENCPVAKSVHPDIEINIDYKF